MELPLALLLYNFNWQVPNGLKPEDLDMNEVLGATLQRNKIKIIMSSTVSVLQTVKHNAYDNDPYAKEFGIKISDKLASVEARVLSPPWLKYHDTGREKECLPQVGQWNMMNKARSLQSSM
ncbi:hypothetical protein POM88_038022 [Heracleum sosnowskyi]|uniref:Argonaute linker 2 domain-containing protein n=1 Tax=Heracleum sosnowskyi TaxID=360622 RepID=A0AAD8HRB2_9APIA|nr:hypothetical protein POM88_038022 [Heracleum sosnowskyi]